MKSEHDIAEANQLVETLHPSRRKGVTMLRSHYERFRRYILDQITEKKAIVFQELINEAIIEFPSDFDNKVSWYLLMVKLDLEARGLIRVSIEKRPQRIQVLTLARRPPRHLLHP